MVPRFPKWKCADAAAVCAQRRRDDAPFDG
jgi:hypothetical protein